MSKSLLPAVAAVLLAVTVLPSASAYGYLYPNDKWCTSVSVYNGASDADYRLATDVARALWNNVPMAISVGVGTSTNNKIAVGEYADAGDDAYGREWKDVPPSNGCFVHSVVQFNMAWNKVHGPIEYRLYRAVHEIGHSLNLVDRWDASTDIMYGNTEPVSRGIVHPTFDAINGVVNKQGSYYSTFSSRSSAGDAWASPTSYPDRIYASSAGSNRVLAYNSWGTTSSTKAMLANAVVTPSTLYRYGLGFYASTNPTDQSKRATTVEVDNNGIKFVATNLNGGSLVKTLLTSPTANTPYFVQAVMVRVGTSNTFWGNACAWFVKPDGNEGQFFGCALTKQSDIGYGNPPATVYVGHAAWSESTGTSDYRLAKANGYLT